MADEKLKDDPNIVHLDAATTLRVRMDIAEVKERASAGRAQMIEDYLTNQLLIAATQNTQLKAANEVLTAKVDDLEAASNGQDH